MTLKGSVLSVGGVTNEDGSIYIYSSPATYTGHQRFWQRSPHEHIWDFYGDSPNLYSYIRLKGSSYLRFNSLTVAVEFYKPYYSISDDRIKENEELIENACETLSKLRPQIYDKKPDIDNDDPTTWYRESGLIAQEIYYDAPELRHLVHKGKPELDEEGNEIPLPEIPTSLDPQQDPNYSSWGKDPASVNYIGLIAYLVKANNELHERVKLLESK